MSATLMGAAFYLPIPSTDKLVLIALADHANDEGESVRPGNNRLGIKASSSESTTRRALHRLEERKLIERVKYAKGGRGHAVEWKIDVAKVYDTARAHGWTQARTQSPTTETQSQTRSPVTTFTETQSPTTAFTDAKPGHQEHLNPVTSDTPTLGTAEGIGEGNLPTPLPTTPREAGTNPRLVGSNPRARGTNPRAVGRALAFAIEEAARDPEVRNPEAAGRHRYNLDPDKYLALADREVAAARFAACRRCEATGLVWFDADGNPTTREEPGAVGEQCDHRLLAVASP